jgi:hypothetical protein
MVPLVSITPSQRLKPFGAIFDHEASGAARHPTWRAAAGSRSLAPVWLIEKEKPVFVVDIRKECQAVQGCDGPDARDLLVPEGV